MTSVRLSSASDFITPSLACVKPVQIDTSKKNRVLRIEGTDGAAAEEEEVPKVAKVTLNDCLACAGCITSAETVLVEQQSIEEFERMLSSASSAYDLVVVSLSAPARAAIAVHSGLGLRETHGRISGFLKGIGCHSVLDCGVASDLSLMQAAAEFVHRFRAASASAAAAAAIAAPAGGAEASEDSAMDVSDGPAGPTSVGALPLPVLTSSCPGWICYAEKMVGEAVLPYLSRVKSPQQVAGTLIKYAHAAACGIAPERVCHVSIMPCFDKKLEAARDDFFNASAGKDGTRDVDCVLSSAELLTLLERRGCASLGVAPGCEPDVTPPYSGLAAACVEVAGGAAAGSGGSSGSGGAGSGGAGSGGAGSDGSSSGDGGGNSSGEGGGLGAIGAFTYAAPGASGGMAEFVFRVAAKELFGVDLPPGPMPWVQGRNADIHELELQQGGATVLKFCRAYGFRNIQNIVRRAKSGKCPYQLVELMACPGGCANGGGQPRPPRGEAQTRTAAVEAMLVHPEETRPRWPIEHPTVQALYADGGFLAGGPQGEACQRHLLTAFHAIDPSKQNPLTISW